MDLWPEEITESSGSLSPLTLIKEQAKLLGEKTNSIVLAGVRQKNVNSQSNYFFYDFFIESGIEMYRFVLFTFRFTYNLYPVYVSIDEDIENEFIDKLKIFQSKDTRESVIKTEEDMINILGLILNSTKTKKIIRALVEMNN